MEAQTDRGDQRADGTGAQFDASSLQGVTPAVAATPPCALPLQVQQLTQQLDRELQLNDNLRQQVEALQTAIHITERHLQQADAQLPEINSRLAALMKRQCISIAEADTQRYAENLEFIQGMGLLCPHQYALVAATAPTWPAPGSLAERFVQASAGGGSVLPGSSSAPCSPAVTSSCAALTRRWLAS
jgi:hypothetical protein